MGSGACRVERSRNGFSLPSLEKLQQNLFFLTSRQKSPGLQSAKPLVSFRQQRMIFWNNHALPIFTFDGGVRWITFLPSYWK